MSISRATWPSRSLLNDEFTGGLPASVIGIGVDIVDIVGNLGVKIEDFTGRDGSLKTVAAIHVNDAKVTTSVSAPF